MEYCVCVAVESTQYPQKSYIPLENAKKKWCLEMEYCVCVTVESDSIPTQIVYSIVKRLKKWSFAMEYRVCVTVKSSQYSHNVYILEQTAKKMVVCDGISCLCGC